MAPKNVSASGEVSNIPDFEQDYQKSLVASEARTSPPETNPVPNAYGTSSKSAVNMHFEEALRKELVALEIATQLTHTRSLSSAAMLEPTDMANLGILEDTAVKTMETSREVNSENFVCSYGDKHWIFDRYYKDANSLVKMKHVVQMQYEKSGAQGLPQSIVVKNIVTTEMFDFLDAHPELGKSQFELSESEQHKLLSGPVNGRSIESILKIFGLEIDTVRLSGLTANLLLRPT